MLYCQFIPNNIISIHFYHSQITSSSVTSTASKSVVSFDMCCCAVRIISFQYYISIDSLLLLLNSNHIIISLTTFILQRVSLLCILICLLCWCCQFISNHINNITSIHCFFSITSSATTSTGGKSVVCLIYLFVLVLSIHIRSY